MLSFQSLSDYASHTWAECLPSGQTMLLKTSALVITTSISIYLAVVFYRASRLCQHEPPTAPATFEQKILNPNKFRKDGEWHPVKFTVPLTKTSALDLCDVNPLPYRPFRWGPYHITMGIKPMPWDDWIELDNEFCRYHRIRTHRIRERGDRVVRVLPDRPGLVSGASAAVIELLHELAEYLYRRHPKTYSVVRHVDTTAISRDFCSWNDTMPIKSITIIPLGITYEFPCSNDGSRRALEIAASLTRDDLAVMVEGVDGTYYFQAGAITVAGSWRLEEKIGMSLDEIHISGNVPQYAEKLQTSMGRYFKRLPVDKPVVRTNYTIHVGPRQSADGETHVSLDAMDEDLDLDDLAWATSTHGSEDAVDDRNTELHVKPVITPERLFLRTERQALRRLPRTGALVFTIRTYLCPVVDLARETGVPGRLASAVRSWSEEVAQYKSQETHRKMLLDYLDAQQAEQVRSGRVDFDIDTSNLGCSF